MGRKEGWTFFFPTRRRASEEVRVTPGPRWASSSAGWPPLLRLRFALGLLFQSAHRPPNPRRMKRLGDLPPELRGVDWPPGVTPLGLYLSRQGQKQVLLTLPEGEALRFQAYGHTMNALMQACLRPSGYFHIGFFRFPTVFALNARQLIASHDPWPSGPLALSLIGQQESGDSAFSLTLTRPPGVRWSVSNGAPHVLLAPGSDVHAAFAHWLTEGQAQGWTAEAPLFGARQAFARLDGPGRTVVLQAALFPSPWGEVWGAALEQGFLDHLARQASEPVGGEPAWSGAEEDGGKKKR